MSFHKPWISMWTQPKATIRSIIEKNPNHQLPFLATIYGLYSLLGLAQTFSWGNLVSLLPLIILIIALAPIWGYLIFSILSGFVYITGKWIGGKGTYKEVRAAFAWSHVPVIVSNFLWILFLAIFQEALFQGFPQEKANALAAFFILLASGCFLILGIWTLVLYIQSLSEVQKFSALRSISNIFLASIVFFAVFFLILLSFVHLIKG
ncbi:MAG: Yip1 family protein [Chlamydiota bacterium]